MTSVAIPSNIQKTITNHALGAAAVGVPGAFAAHADLGVLGGIWARMIVRIAEQTDVDIDFKSAAKIAATLGIAIGTIGTGVKAANTYFAWSGVGTPLAILFNSSANGIATNHIGKAVASVMLKDNVSPEDIIRAALGVLGVSAADIAIDAVNEASANIVAKGPQP